MASFEPFLKQLQQQPNTDTVANPYRHPHCVENLRHYLQLMQQEQPQVLLVGEAPGYKGCGLTGIPFSSGKLFQQVEHPFLQRLAPLLEIPVVDAENTASIVWRYLAETGVTPLFWNAYPFHPHPEGDPQKNRAPNGVEISQGVDFLQQLYSHFQPQIVAGVGRAGCRAAEQSFSNFTISYIRHPSYGGKSDFIAGMEQLYHSIMID